ncbi:MAG TPA: dihydropteroate synthase [Kofleriaceae bacterium]
MGVINVTPDSFSDGGQFSDVAAAVAYGLRLRDEGADILDVGGEATNPRAFPVPAEVELERVLPVVERLAAAGAVVSIDTTKAAVARACVAAGAQIVNDVSGGLFDPAMGEAIGDAIYICGHLRGRSLAEVFALERSGAPDRAAAPEAVRSSIEERANAVTWRDVAAELDERLAALPDAVAARAWIDPGIGFGAGKGGDPERNLDLIRHSGDLGRALGKPVVIGASRKRFLRVLSGTSDPAALDAASVGAALGAVAAGARVLRTHNVALLRAALAVYTKL